ncbi:uncharacterized protein [Nicotiana sylvestris]|uniref:uncharacterized protein n=1 Tax=Nicotiana sylvestris TaxID=4096 RepID=UPI00388CE6A5
MYQDLRQHYWRRRMKDIVAYVARCLNCQQVKYEHQRPGGFFQRIEIPEWKWERITTNFVVGLPQTQRKFDAVWVIVDRLTKSAHFISVAVFYSSERQKSNADRKVRDVAFMVREQVLLQVSPMKGMMRFGKKGKLSPRIIGPFEILDRVGEVAYRLPLPPSLSTVYLVFHVSMLRKYHGDPSHVLDFSTVQLDKDLTYEKEPLAILDWQVCQLRSKNFPSAHV